MQAQMEKMAEKKKGFFKWKKLAFRKSIGGETENVEQHEAGTEFRFGMQNTPTDLM